MRNAFIEELIRLAEEDERVVLLTGDLGFMVLDEFAVRFPDRFFNAGVAEQNMTGMATGLAEAGFVPFTYSIATFAALRPYEFVRNGGALHQLPVRILGIGGGFDYGHNGISHFALEDIGVMRIQPRVGVVAPADAAQARSALWATRDEPGPIYFRLAKGTNSVPGLDGRFRRGRMELIGDGSDVAIVSIGTTATAAAEAAERLAEQGIGATVGVVSNLNPAPTDDLLGLMRRCPVTVTVEAHYITGGVGSLACEVAAEHDVRTRVVRLGVTEMPSGHTGTKQGLERRFGLDADAIVAAAMTALERTGGQLSSS